MGTASNGGYECGSSSAIPVQLIAPLFGHALVYRKRQRPLTGVNETVLLPTAKGLTTEGIAAHFAEVFRVRVPGTNARIRETVIGEMTAGIPIGGLGRRPTE
ncbi:hypothetical protein [Arthrobacter globiformis]|uniref:hypothetical protein n=1 Tax=Arthrobacter globiformis TaxID=1665 RepID=UPI0027D7BE9E|nr:hypothetical protein [Arthrobacter globiformis]